MSARATSGFTLAEVLVALAILGTGLFVLVGAHQSAMQLQLDSEAVLEERQLLEGTIARAEVALMTGSLSAAGEFGPRYPGYSWAFDAQNVSTDGQVPLYQVTARLQTPDGEKSLDFFYFDTGPATESTDRADLSGKSSVRRGAASGSRMSGSDGMGRMGGSGRSSASGTTRGSRSGSGRSSASGTTRGSRSGSSSRHGTLFNKDVRP